VHNAKRALKPEPFPYQTGYLPVFYLLQVSRLSPPEQLPVGQLGHGTVNSSRS